MSDAAKPVAGNGRRTGRPAGSPPNRDAILAAARQQFGERGYDKTTIRGIARVAGVDPALVHHYFGSKDALFVAALSLPVNPAEVVPEILSGGQDQLGERLMRRFLDIWTRDTDHAASALAGLLRSAASHEEAGRLMREFFTREVLERVAEALDMPHPRLRAALAASQLIGLAWTRYLIQVEPMTTVDQETLIACCGPVLQRYLTEPLPIDRSALDAKGS
jgi:AcrR family transcriptional regulator